MNNNIVTQADNDTQIKKIYFCHEQERGKIIRHGICLNGVLFSSFYSHS
jgi:hypothetical protein